MVNNDRKNAFESGQQKTIPAVLVYLRRGDEILMIHRNSNQVPTDFHRGKWNALGGKCESGESSLDAAHRELKEESGLDLPLTNFKPLGVIQFPNFKAHLKEDWIVFVFAATLVQDEQRLQILKENSEGRLEWIPTHEILSLNLWPGDRFFIPLVLDFRPFFGAIWYENQEVAKHWIYNLDRVRRIPKND